MIVSLTPDESWKTMFASTPQIAPVSGPLLVIAPHPDDETLGAGMLIASLRSKGVDVEVIAATDGENAYDTPAAQREELRRLREQEQTQALNELGVSSQHIHRLRLTDSGLATEEHILTDAIANIAKPRMTLLAPWQHDFHPDHEACARAAATVAQRFKLPLISYFFWTWHRGVPSMLHHLPLRSFHGTEALMQAKASALRCHRSQLEREEEEPILPQRLLGPASWNFEVFLTHD